MLKIGSGAVIFKEIELIFVILVLPVTDWDTDVGPLVSLIICIHT